MGVSSDARTCPHCGARKPGAKKRSVIEWIGGGFLLFIVIAVIFSESEESEPVPDRTSNQATATADDPDEAGNQAAATADDPDKTEAWVMAERFVRNRLNSPSTASFSDLSGNFPNPEQAVTILEDNQVLIQGFVDAENAFGGTVREQFVCQLEYQGDSNWRLVSLDFL